MNTSEWSFIQLSDIHIGESSSKRFQPAWIENFKTALGQIKNLERQPKFLIVSGDLTRDGKTRPSELHRVKGLLEDLDWPVYTIPGNHDVGHRFHLEKPSHICREMYDSYISILGGDRFCVEHGDLRLVGFNSFLVDSDLSEREEHWDWLETMTRLDNGIKRQLWFMHSAPFFVSSDEPEVAFGEDGWYSVVSKATIQRLMGLMRKGAVQGLACGHIHMFHDRMVDGFRFVTCPSTAFRQHFPRAPGPIDLGFLEWTVAPDDFRVKRHLVDPVSTLPGIGNNPGV